MPWFFTESEIPAENYIIEGENASHISKSLRMKPGEELTLVTPSGEQLDCVIDSVYDGNVSVCVQNRQPCRQEPNLEITLYQALPKGDKMEYIIQKCVELGITRIVPMISARCVSRPDSKSLAKKQKRWQKIALQAAQQSRRGIIPEVCEAVSFSKAVEISDSNEQNIIFYEEGGDSVRELIKEPPKTLGIFIGSEGGFEQTEVELVTSRGGSRATLGKRILRAETAPLAALSVIMFATGNFE